MSLEDQLKQLRKEERAVRRAILAELDGFDERYLKAQDAEFSFRVTGLGYKLTTVRRGSSIERLGFRSGDTITHVNGHALADDADAMALYFGLGQTSTFQVRYLRGGSPGVRTIKVR